MMARLRGLWDSRSIRDKVVVVAAALIAVTMLYIWLVQSATQARTRLTATISTLRTQAAQLQQHAVEYAKLRTSPAPTAARTDLRTVVQNLTDSAGLSKALVKTDVQDANRMQLTFGAVAFADWLDWATALQSQQIRIEACRIEALSTAGLVSITVSLARTPAQ